ncbi:GFA family protein [Solimonas terrae]|uniref:CENP-V/GFA domain-containing protein n=1 Tax=Solimonas terrae TaxID=1396819 RepID=A0A6M2BRH8_9GAMM|nr:GFA family protein [Solimonas terrae]NGY05206.1 hypothetical protein [Solimonas terrae]
MTQQNCQCTCGHAKFEALGRPLFRGYCHCTICQAFNQAPYADISVFRGNDVVMPEAGTVQYKTLRPPPAVQRGVCAACGKPAIEYLKMFPMPKLIIVPTANIRDAALIPAPSLHIFYNRRLADIDDGLPKFSGYWKSQLGFGRHLLASLLRKNA